VSFRLLSCQTFPRWQLLIFEIDLQYCGEFDNWGAIMSVSGELLCSFELLKPLDSTALKNHIKKGRKERNNMLSSPVSNPKAPCSFSLFLAKRILWRGVTMPRLPFSFASVLRSIADALRSLF
jgi:hypothetical protein